MEVTTGSAPSVPVATFGIGRGAWGSCVQIFYTMPPSRPPKGGSPNNGRTGKKQAAGTVWTSQQMNDRVILEREIDNLWVGWEWHRVRFRKPKPWLDSASDIRARLLEQEGSACFWRALLCCSRLRDRNLYPMVKAWFLKHAGVRRRGISTQEAVELVASFPLYVAVYQVSGTVVCPLAGLGGPGIAYVDQGDCGYQTPHWLPFEWVAETPNPFNRVAESVCSADQSEQAPEDEATSSPPPESGPQPPPKPDAPEAPADGETPLTSDAPDAPADGVEGDEEDDGGDDDDWLQVDVPPTGPALAPYKEPEAPAVRYLSSHSRVPPFIGQAYQRQPNAQLRTVDTHANWSYGFFQSMFGAGQAFECKESILIGATIHADAILFARRTVAHKLDFRMNEDGAYFLSFVETIQASGRTFILGPVSVITNRYGERWEWARTLLVARPFPSLPMFKWTGKKVERINLFEIPSNYCEEDHFPNKTAMLRTQYSLLKATKAIPDDLVGILNDVRMEHFADVEATDLSPFAVARTLLESRETLARSGRSPLAFSHA